MPAPDRQDQDRETLARELDSARQRIAQLETIVARRSAPTGKDAELLRVIAENLPSTYLSLIESDRTIGFSAGAEFRRQGLDPDAFVGATLEEVFGDHAALVRSHYERTFAGEERTFELTINDQRQRYRTVPLRAADGTIPRILAVTEDITEHERTLEALRRSEERFRRMFERHSAAMLLIEPDSGRIVEANPAAAAFYGHEREALQRLTIQQINALSDEEIARRRSEAIGGTANVFCLPHRLRDGSVAHVEVHSSPVEIDGAQLLFSVIHDVTQRELAEQALRESEQRLRSYVESAPYGVFVADERGRYLEVNPAASAITGYSADELRAMSVQDLVPPERQGFAREHFATVQQTGRARGTGPFRTRDGEDRFWSIDAVKLSETRSLGFVADVTERERQRQQLRDEKDRTQRYLDTAAVILLGLDAEGRISLLNRRGYEILGVDPAEDLNGRDWFDFIPAAQRDEVRALHRANLSGEIAKDRQIEDPIEGPIETASGERRTILWHNALVPDAEGAPVGTLSSGQDVTELREMQAQLAQADRLASMGMLAAGVAHEINNPLSYTLFNLESLNEDLPRLLGALRRLAPRVELDDEAARATSAAVHDEILDRFRGALEGSQRIRAVARNLSTFARVEQDELAPVSLEQVIEVATGMAFNEIKYRAELIKDYGKTPTILAGEGRLCQVFINLLINAAQAIDEGQREENQIHVRTRVEGDELVAQIEDTGPGIPPERCARLFEPFYSTKRVGVGSGLGLTISRSIVEGYGGTLDVESEVGRGTCFTVRLPLVRTPASDAAPAPARPGAEPAERGRILIIDDEPRLRAALAHMLRAHETVPAASGTEARQILEQDLVFDLILCDVMMPGQSGIDFHRWLVDRHPTLAERLVFVTGGAFTPRVREYLGQVETLVLQKPIERAELQKIANQMIRQAKRRGVS